MPHRPLPSRPRIRRRFTLLYASTLLLVLLGAALVTRFALRAALQEQFDESVRASAAMVSRFFRTEIAEYQTTEATLTHITGELVFEDRSIHIRRPGGGHFGDSLAMTRRPRGIQSGPEVEPMRAVRVPLDARLAPGWDVEVHASMANMHALQTRIDRGFLIGIPLLVLLAAIAGWWLTGRTLRPVGAMADAAARIAPASGTRLPIEHPADELGRLGVGFNALLDRLDGALAQQRQFLADAAHELRTPIARMRARVELALLNDGVIDRPHPAPAELLGALDAELQAMTHQVDELLQLARADAMGDAQLERVERFFLDDLVADEAPRWQPQAETLRRSMRFGSFEETAVAGDAVLLGRLIGILIDNALRYGRDGGLVELVVRSEGAWAYLEVSDDGIGIPDGERPRIFDRFYRGAAARQHAEGSGLGLAIAAWIIRQHGGSIAADAGPLGGARFIARLPLAPPVGAAAG